MIGLNFALFWSKVTKKATQLNIDEPALPRKRKRTVRYESGNAAPEFHTSIEGYYRQAYFEVLDVICSTIEDRFRQPGYQLRLNINTCRYLTLTLAFLNTDVKQKRYTK